MQSGPITIDGVRGPILVSSSGLTGRHEVTVDGQPAERLKGGKFALPAADGGTVEAKVSSSFNNPFPTVEVAGVKHPTGPPLSILLQVLMVLPLGLVIVGGLLGGLVGAGAVAVNTLIARGTQSTIVKALLMVGALIIAAGVWYLLAGTLATAIRA